MVIPMKKKSRLLEILQLSLDVTITKGKAFSRIEFYNVIDVKRLDIVIDDEWLYLNNDNNLNINSIYT